MRGASAIPLLLLALATGCGPSGPSEGTTTYSRERAVSACDWDPGWIDNQPVTSGERVTFFAADPSTDGVDRAVVWPDRVVCVRGDSGPVETIYDHGKVGEP